MPRIVRSWAWFLAWVLFSIFVPARVIVSGNNGGPVFQKSPTLDHQLMQKLYERLQREATTKEDEYKSQLDQLRVFEHGVDEQIKGEQKRLLESQGGLEMMRARNDEISIRIQVLTRQAQADPVNRSEIEKQINQLRAQRTATEKQRSQYVAAVERANSNIKRLSEYPLSAGTGWTFNPDQFSTVAAARRQYQLDLNEAQSEKAMTNQKYEAWNSSGGSQGTLVAFLSYAASQGASCVVDIESQKDSKETTGATIKYQTPEQRQFGASPRTAKSTTKCLGEKMKPNRYYIWTQRNAAETSSRNELFPIADQREAVKLIEK